jgi:hypothetical protein
VWLEKIVHSSKAFPYFIVLLIIKIDSSSIKVHALLDFGASICFINKDFADRHKLPLITKKHHIPVEAIDRRPLMLGDVIHEIILLDIVLEGYHSIIAFNVIKPPSNPIVLGLLGLINIIQLLTGRPKDWLFIQTLLQSKNPIIGKLLQLQIINNSSHVIGKYQRFKYH